MIVLDLASFHNVSIEEAQRRLEAGEWTPEEIERALGDWDRVLAYGLGRP